MYINKAVVACGGRGTRFLPITRAMPKEFLPLVDRPCLDFILDELVASSIKQVLIILNSEKDIVRKYYQGSYARTDIEISFVNQDKARGNGDALLYAQDFCANEPFVVCWGDDIIFAKKPATLQLIEQFHAQNATIIGCQTVLDNTITKYGVVKPLGVYDLASKGCVIDKIEEKPPLDKVPSRFAAMGRYIVKANIFDYLLKTPPSENGEIQFTTTLNLLAKYEQVCAYAFEGRRHDMGDKLGSLIACIEYGLTHPETGEGLKNYLKNFKTAD